MSQDQIIALPEGAAESPPRDVSTGKSSSAAGSSGVILWLLRRNIGQDVDPLTPAPPTT